MIVEIFARRDPRKINSFILSIDQSDTFAFLGPTNLRRWLQLPADVGAADIIGNSELECAVLDTRRSDHRRIVNKLNFIASKAIFCTGLMDYFLSRGSVGIKRHDWCKKVDGRYRFGIRVAIGDSEVRNMFAELLGVGDTNAPNTKRLLFKGTAINARYHQWDASEERRYDGYPEARA